MKPCKSDEAVEENKDQITLFIDGDLAADSEYSAAISALQHTFAAKYDFVITALAEQSLPTSILLLCQNEEHGTSLSNRFNLHGLQVFWLPQDPSYQPLKPLINGHWYLDWKQPPTVLPVLSLIQQQHRLLADFSTTKQKLSMLTECLGEMSLTLNSHGQIIEMNAPLLKVMGESGKSVIGQTLLSCLHIPSSIAKRRMTQILADLSRTHSMTRLPPFPVQLKDAVVMLDGFVGPFNHDDTLLILRQIASWQNQEWLEQSAAKNTPVTLLLVNPDDFAAFNQQYGRDIGDQVLAEIIQCMSDLLRSADFASRFSGAVFAAHLPETNEQQGQVLASRMREMLRKKRFSAKKVNLDFSFGLATIESEEQLNEHSPLELFRRANAALQAARSIGGGTLVCWQPKFDANILANLDRMSGKFSDAADDDFKLITLQWDIIRIIGSTHDLQSFSEQVCQLISSGMSSMYAGLYLTKGDGLINLSCASEPKVEVKSVHQWVTTNIQVDNLDNLTAVPLLELNATTLQASVPLVTRGKCLGVIVLRWHSNQQPVAKKYTELLQQVSANLGTAIDRIILLDQSHKQGNSPAKSEPDNHQTHELLFESAAMRTLMQQVQLVAPTDASVLLIGESGTGKEVIARQIHNHGLQPNKPFITVDCSTIVKHLIESELFGHRKGAFTGATSDQPGMIAQADGGTLFLDEVGELPLDIQSKLLRFVQEKTFVAVGDQRVRKVDVRLVLATNRNLSDEVAAGRFRADLYYRINVFTLNLPPLNQRGEDTLLLARHFLKKFSQQYNKPILDISSSAVETLRRYSWPGNVRELRNCIMRAVITCPSDYLESEHLNLQAPSLELQPSASHATPSLQTVELTQDDDEELLPALTVLLNKVVCLATQQPTSFPVTVWLEKLWIELCLQKWGSLYQVALKVEQSESTLRRRSAKLKDTAIDHPLLEELTVECSSLLQRFLDGDAIPNLWSTLESTMYAIVVRQQITQQAKAKLLDVTQPTLRKIMQQYQG
ncbi:sigma 54-interacting transcriptional regulator [Aliiglaciecola sp. NS0011-25]|uniref:sigma 54-interacting transcriptional regulator n=1 Tax=Aliiglaciecola sp. NS0011-25 TaxID=3127654 RepID=UPI00310512B6